MPTIFKRFINMVIPPRPTEEVVDEMSLEYLRSLQTEEGLPYRDADVKALVWELKYRANPRAASLAGELLADELLALAAEEIGTPLLIPIPMHNARRAQRGHNQTELLCEAAVAVLTENGRENSLARENSPKRELRYGRPEDFFPAIFEYAPTILIRTINTPTQQGLARHKRLKNVHGSMHVTDPTKVKDRVCVVVDDVSTTGATLAEAKRALRHAGARAVYLVSLAYS